MIACLASLTALGISGLVRILSYSRACQTVSVISAVLSSPFAVILTVPAPVVLSVTSLAVVSVLPSAKVATLGLLTVQTTRAASTVSLPLFEEVTVAASTGEVTILLPSLRSTSVLSVESL